MNKRNKILKYWSTRSKKKNLKCTNDHLLEKFEIQYILPKIKKNSKVLDIGCGDGSLLKELFTKKKIKGVGIDFSNELIKVAKKKSKKIKFICYDMLKIKELKQEINAFDYIITKRSIQNLTSWNYQKKFLNELHKFCKKNTKIILVESSKIGLQNINLLRRKFNLKNIKMPWHNLYLDDNKIIKSRFKKIKLVKIEEIFSTYYFISRIINAIYSKNLKRQPKYNDHLNFIGWKLPQDIVKNYSQLKVYNFKKISS